jgi:RimJ/RimL family protein N-acetyltransferase
MVAIMIKPDKHSLHKVLYYLKTFRETTRVDYGPGFFKMLVKIYYSFFRVNSFIVFTFEGDVGIIPAEDNVFVIRDFKALDKYRQDGDVPKELCCDKIHAVTSCLVMEVENTLAYIHWIYTKGDSSRFILIGDGVAEINNVLTVPRFRGNKITERMVRYASHALLNGGYRKIVAVIHDENIASIKSFTRAGFVRQRVIRSYGFFNRKITI